MEDIIHRIDSGMQKKKILKARDKQFSSCGKSLGEFRRLIGKVGFVTS